jgi:hypothetical protein
MLEHSRRAEIYKNKLKAVLVTGRGCPKVTELSRFLHFLENSNSKSWTT